MSSRKLSDKEFDRYARNILKKPESIPFDKKAWSAMEQQLAGGEGSSSFLSLKWLIPVSILFLTLLGLIGYQYFDAPQQISEKTDNVETSIGLVELSTKKTNSTVGNNGEAMNETTGSFQTLPEQKDERISKSTINESFEAKATSSSDKEPLERISSSSNNSSSSINQTQAVLTSQENEPIGTNTLSEKATGKKASNKSLASLPISEETAFQEQINETLEKPINDKEEVVRSLEPVKTFFISNQHPILSYPKGLEEQGEITSTTGQQNKDRVFSRWSVGLVLAPDFTTVGRLNEFTKPGLDAGVTVAYFISNNLSVVTGAIFTRKLYNTTDIGEYTVPYGFWSVDWLPSEIFANCRVIDIPINLRYRLVEGRKTSLLASVGMSSYLMLNERYDYDYGDWQNNGRQPEGWEVSNQNNHFFGVYNLSAIISRRIRRKISIEAEPFLKNSLGGVGWGQVRLKSTGVLFHAKYHF